MVKAFILLNVKSGTGLVMEKLTKIKVSKAHFIYGKYDFMIIIDSSTIDILKTNIFAMQKMPNVISTLTMMVVE
jgi:hypothetical protein